MAMTQGSDWSWISMASRTMSTSSPVTLYFRAFLKKILFFWGALKGTYLDLCVESGCLSLIAEMVGSEAEPLAFGLIALGQPCPTCLRDGHLGWNEGVSGDCSGARCQLWVLSTWPSVANEGTCSLGHLDIQKLWLKFAENAGGNHFGVLTWFKHGALLQELLWVSIHLLCENSILSEGKPLDTAPEVKRLQWVCKFHTLLVMCPWTSHTPSLCLNLLICIVRVIIVINSTWFLRSAVIQVTFWGNSIALCTSMGLLLIPSRTA